MCHTFQDLERKLSEYKNQNETLVSKLAISEKDKDKMAKSVAELHEVSLKLECVESKNFVICNTLKEKENHIKKLEYDYEKAYKIEENLRGKMDKIQDEIKSLQNENNLVRDDLQEEKKEAKFQKDEKERYVNS